MKYEAGILDRSENKLSQTEHNPQNQEHWGTVKFDKPFKVVPVVHVSVQTMNGSNTPGVRIDDVTKEGFRFRMNEIVVDDPKGAAKRLSDGNHTNERIGWIAVEPTQD